MLRGRCDLRVGPCEEAEVCSSTSVFAHSAGIRSGREPAASPHARLPDWVNKVVSVAGSICYGVRMGTAPIGSRVSLNYDLMPAEGAKTEVTTRISVENRGVL